jgi:prepilin-type N-terminal cleavage/methylation domain-containing protein
MLSKKRVRIQGSTVNASHRRSHAGFTLAELLVSILLTSIIMAAVYSVYRMQTHTMKIQENRLDAQEYARSVLDLMVREIRNAGYFPVGACTTTPANTNGIITADSQTLRFVYDSNAANGCADADENIEYRFVQGSCPTGFGDIKRKTVNPANDQAMTDCNVMSSFSLTYYAKDSSTPLSSPVALANIQRISISLTVQSKNPDPQFGGQQLNATLTSNVDLRNRGLPS